MAKLYPRHPRRNATRGERLVLSLLEGLDDNWYVLHSLEYIGAAGGRTRPGEADFVLLHRAFGMIVLEVKDGQYRVEKRRWTAVRRDGTEIELPEDPFQQAKKNRFALRNLLRQRTGVANVPVGHTVLFTDGSPSGRLGLDAPDAIVLTLASVAASPAHAIRGVVEFWQLGTWSSDEDFALVMGELCPTSVIAPSISYTMELAAVELDRRTAKQIEFTTEQLEAMEVTGRSARAVVLGAAGTGKTVIAQELARRLAAGGARVALIGQHRHLRLQLRRAMRLGGVSCGDPDDVLADLYGPAALAVYEGQDAWVAAFGLAEQHGRRLDHLIVDEAQSHEPDMLEAMQEIVRADGRVLLLADPFQRDAEGAWQPPGEYERVRLTRNCRNVLPIAKVVARLSGSPTPGSGAAGNRPLFTDSKEPQHDGVAVVRDLLAQLSADRVVVLTEDAAAQQGMRDALLRARIDAPAVTTRLGESGLLVSTVDNFRGCEAEAIVYVTQRPESFDRTSDYIAVSRACAHLHIVGARTRWESVAYLMGDPA